MAARDGSQAAPTARRPAVLAASPWWGTGALSVLVADEDPAARADLQSLLGNRAQVTLCTDGAEALWEAGRILPSVVVLSATLPVVPAADVASLLAHRRERPASIVVGVGFGQVDRVGPVLAAGANRVMSRPYQAREVSRLLREHLAQLGEHRQRLGVLRVGALELNGPAFEASAAGRPLRLNLREFELLGLLMLHAGSVVSQQQIREELWEARGDSVSANTIAVHIRRLRARLDGVADIHAVRGVGYRLRVGAPEAG
jgi:two-component system, OmpR family, response regulator